MFVEKHNQKKGRTTGHTLRHEGLLKLMMEGTTEGNGYKGRPNPVSYTHLYYVTLPRMLRITYAHNVTAGSAG